MDILDKAEEAKKLIDAVNGLRRDAMVFIVLVALIVLAYFILKMILTFKKAEKAEENKQRRAEVYAAGLNNVASASNVLGRVVIELKTSVESLAAKITGKINYADSKRMIEHRFFHDVKNDVCREFARSLTENNFAEREAHVERLVKTNIGRILIVAREHLFLFNMCLDPASFFESIPEKKNVERFVLCELIWEKVKPLYKSPLSLKNRIEESQVLIDNAIQDYVNSVMSLYTQPEKMS